MPIRIRNLSQVLTDLGRYPIKVGKTARLVQQAIARDMFAHIVSRTPVDSGFARGSWRMNTGSRLGSTADKQEFKPRSSRGEIDFAAAKAKGTSVASQQVKNLKFRPGGTDIPTIFITNNVPYIGLLEGTEGGPISSQAPTGIVIPAKNAAIQRLKKTFA